ncbi:uncharacterized protein LOC121381968 [Gigantopelta aegis]|uniref:uncharacterized protein LOC121381968 n=1 Tax=Gigantopelta aegis TaxID=1735272 RepID=UPI001B889C40|nr:uncharacterized protein LOC121381968 [Gigantopelta aegis]
MIFVNFYVLFLGLFKFKVYCDDTSSKEDESIILHHLFKRNIAEDIGPIPQTQPDLSGNVNPSSTRRTYSNSPYNPASGNQQQYPFGTNVYNPSGSRQYPSQESNSGSYHQTTNVRHPTGRRYPNSVSYPVGPILSTNSGQVPYHPRYQQPTSTRGQPTGTRGQPTGTRRQPTLGGGQQTVYNNRQNPGAVQPTYTQQGGTYPYNPSAPFGCQETGIRLRINGMDCPRAIDHYGSFLCYRHEFTSRDCCEKCRQLKNPGKIGCEYGDHSYQCRQIQPFDCYDLRNRQSCCETCEQHRTGELNCEYGDMTPRCQRVAQNPSMCYSPENQRLCCSTCRRVSRNDNPECPWGDQNSELCRPFDQFGGVRINCYSETIRRLCCQTCQRLQQRMPNDMPDSCRYGDRPVIFNTNQFGSLNCTSFFRHFPVEQCRLNQAVLMNCCFTCYRYTRPAG